MKYALFSTLVLLTFLIISCQKDYILEDIDDPLPVDTTQTTSPTNDIDSTLSSNNGGLLMKMFIYDKVENKVDSSVANYIYDDKNRLVEYNDYAKNIETPEVKDYGTHIRITRDPSGMIKQIIFVTILFEWPGDDEPHYDIKYEFNYDAGLYQYKYAIMTGYQEGHYVRDSMVYEYNNNEQISRIVTYGTSYTNLPTKSSLNVSYDNNDNIIRRNKFFEYEGEISESYDITYSYDDRAATGRFDELAVLMAEEFNYVFPTGKNNIVSGADRLGRSEFPKISYLYNAFNKPTRSAYIYDDDSGDTGTVMYFYKK